MVPENSGISEKSATAMLSAVPRRSLLAKYATYGAVMVSTLLAASGVVYGYFSWRETMASQSALLAEKARLAAIRISQFDSSIELPLSWASEEVAGGGALEPDQARLELIRLLHHVDAITDLRWIDAAGRERVLVSRLALDAVNSGRDFSSDPAVLATQASGRYVGPVHFIKGTEPYVAIARSRRRDGGLVLAEVNLKFVSDVLSRERIGETGLAYVVDERGLLVSHSDVSEVLRRTDFSELPHVRAALGAWPPQATEATLATNAAGVAVLTAAAPVPELGWTVFAEQPAREALLPVYRSLGRTALLILFGVAVAILASIALARRLVRPIRALQSGAAQIGAGRLGQRIEVGTGDELEALGEQFNRMAERLQQTYSNLESRISERTRELSSANEAKTRFLAAASHDLRQPLHALTLYVGQLRNDCTDNSALALLAQRIEASVDALRDLLDALLDLSKLDAGGVVPQREALALQPLLERVAQDFGPMARAKGIALTAHRTSLWVDSDARLLERILVNFVVNAVRYTPRGRVAIGCRRRGTRAEIMVIDTGAGIAADQLPLIFREFHQVREAGGEISQGVGLGLAIVERLARLLGHEVKVRSRRGYGSSFAVLVPVAAPRPAESSATPLPVSPGVSLVGLRVLVVDDDAPARAAMAGILARWECVVHEAADGRGALACARTHAMDAVVCDLRLQDAESGFDVLDALRAECAAPPVAIVVTGDYLPERAEEARSRGYAIMAKPTPPARLRALLEQLLRERAES